MSRTRVPAASANFYSPGSYCAEESVGFLMKRVLASVVQQVDRRLEAHDLTHALLDRMEKKGLCKRVRSLEDRRVVNLELTPQGEAAAALVPGVLTEVLNSHLAGFSKTEWQALMHYLRRMIENGEAMRTQD
jgi:DNA-binding MarR family transcriptional regulator